MSLTTKTTDRQHDQNFQNAKTHNYFYSKWNQETNLIIDKESIFLFTISLASFLYYLLVSSIFKQREKWSSTRELSF